MSKAYGRSYVVHPTIQLSTMRSEFKCEYRTQGESRRRDGNDDFIMRVIGSCGRVSRRTAGVTDRSAAARVPSKLLVVGSAFQGPYAGVRCSCCRNQESNRFLVYTWDSGSHKNSSRFIFEIMYVKLLQRQARMTTEFVLYESRSFR